MKVKCKTNYIDDNLAKIVGLAEGQPKLYRSISPDKIYTVLGVTYSINATCYANYPIVEVKNDSGGLSLIPLFLFDVIDSTASKYWKVRHDSEKGLLTMLPESFYRQYYHDDLSEGVKEVVEDFKEVCEKFDSEAETVLL